MYTSGALHYTVYIHHPQLTAISNFVNVMFIHSPEAAGSNHLAAASQTYKIGIALHVVVTAVPAACSQAPPQLCVTHCFVQYATKSWGGAWERGQYLLTYNACDLTALHD